MVYVWLGLIVAFIAVEAATVNLVSMAVRWQGSCARSLTCRRFCSGQCSLPYRQVYSRFCDRF